MYNINRRKFLGLFGCSCCSLILPSCSTVPITERKQLTIIPEAKINNQAAAAYEQFRNKAKLIKDGSQLNEVREIGKKIEIAVSAFFNMKNENDPTKNFEWDYILVDNDKMINAWCMPGGKIAFYTGILPVCKNDDGIAAVMGHEIAHAFARHTVEKLTQSSMIQMATLGISNTRYAELLNKSFKVGNVGGNVYNSVVKYGIFLPFSRTMESEADYLGMGFMNLAGFNVKEPSKLWQRMMADKQGKVPEFMGSHPSPENRSKKFQEWENEILDKFPRV